MKVHLIAIGGAVMHNLAIALKNNGHVVTGSDDDINSPSLERLAEKDLLPPNLGWFPEKITNDLDLVILGMHAKIDNPELLKAIDLGIKIQSFPEFIGDCYKDKLRVVVAGSHGKTTTTSMISHILKVNGIKFDYLIGSNIDGFETMVSITDAPIAIIEGDEYLSSPLDRKSKFLHYNPQIAIITGIAWDHINVFPTFEEYLDTFKKFIDSVLIGGSLIYYKQDEYLNKLVSDRQLRLIPYNQFLNQSNKLGQIELIGANSTTYPINFFGKHNLENFYAAYHATRELRLSENQILSAISTFNGAGKRMELIEKHQDFISYVDFAHAPSKLRSTVEAVKSRHPDFKLIALYELHTFSSFNPEFLKQYKDSLAMADVKVVYYNLHTVKLKNMELIDANDIKSAFGDQNIKVITDNQILIEFLKSQKMKRNVLLWMSSGNFGGLDLKKISNSFAEQILN